MLVREKVSVAGASNAIGGTEGIELLTGSVRVGGISCTGATFTGSGALGAELISCAKAETEGDGFVSDIGIGGGSGCDSRDSARTSSTVSVKLLFS
jgi:hypothetical protein